jgi:hypothetical protein
MRVLRVQFTTNFDLELSDPSDGLTIQDVCALGAEAQVTLHTDVKKSNPASKAT